MKDKNSIKVGVLFKNKNLGIIIIILSNVCASDLKSVKIILVYIINDH